MVNQRQGSPSSLRPGGGPLRSAASHACAARHCSWTSPSCGSGRVWLAHAARLIAWFTMGIVTVKGMQQRCRDHSLRRNVVSPPRGTPEGYSVPPGDYYRGEGTIHRAARMNKRCSVWLHRIETARRKNMNRLLECALSLRHAPGLDQMPLGPRGVGLNLRGCPEHPARPRSCAGRAVRPAESAGRWRCG